MADIKPLTIYCHPAGPNSWKVVIACEELGVPYTLHQVPFELIKRPEYTAINPNGRAPAIQDPNTGITMFESGACVEYLVQQYDTDHKISFANPPEKYGCLCWLHFQMSGQGPYFGQLAWFTHFDPGDKKIEAIDRYANETKRVLGVLESHLGGGVKQTGGVEYLVGNRYTYVDFMFFPWNSVLDWFLFFPGAPGNVALDFANEFPKTFAWHQRMLARPAVAKTLKIWHEERAKGSLQ